MRSVIVACLAVAAAAVPPKEGPLKTGRKNYKVDGMDKSNPQIAVWYPTGDASAKYPLIMYAHGAAGGGFDINGYNTLFKRIASFGFIIAAPMSCFAGCTGGGEYYQEGLKTVDFARNVSEAGKEAWAGNVDLSAVGVAGHSMGAEAVAPMCVEPHASQYNVKAAMYHHCPCGSGTSAGGAKAADAVVPTAFYGGTADTGCLGEAFYDAMTFKPRTMRDQVGMNHLEPVLEGMGNNENPYYGYFTAAWYKVHLAGDKGEYHDAIYGDGADSLCKYAEMKRCENLV